MTSTEPAEPHAFHLEPVRSSASVERLWAELAAERAGSFFTSWIWIGTWLSLLPDALQPRLLIATTQGRPSAAGILVHRNQRRHLLVSSRQLHLHATGDPRFDCLTIEHNGFVGFEARTAAFWKCLLRWFATGAADADELVLPGIADGPPLEEPYRHGGLYIAARVPAYRLELARLSGSNGDLEGILSSNSRQQMRRTIRAVEKQGALRIDEASGLAEAQGYFDGLKELHARSWARRGKPHSFLNPFFETFHRALIECAFPPRAIQMLRISAGSRILGYLYNFRWNGCVYAYQSGFDDGDPELRPGYVCHKLAIEHSFRSGQHTYDFMAGRNRLKESLATQTYAMNWLAVQQPLLRFRIEGVARRLKAAARSRFAGE